jgi:hypothetical protein
MDAKNYSRPAMYVIHSMLRHTAFNEIELILFLEKLYPNGKMKEKKSPRALNCVLSGTDKDALISASPRRRAAAACSTFAHRGDVPIREKWQEQR